MCYIPGKITIPIFVLSNILIEKHYKKSVLCSLAALILLSGCKKAAEIIIEKGTSTSTPAVSEFVKYTIPQGKQYADKNGYKPVEIGEMKFVVKFDSSAVYQTRLAENQFDINKLYGFSDNNADHHQYSARFGWRWNGNALRLFAYIIRVLLPRRN